MVERIQGDSLPLHLLSCESRVFVKKKPDRKKTKKKKQVMVYNMWEQALGVCGWRASWIFHDGELYYTETSLGFWTNQ